MAAPIGPRESGLTPIVRPFAQMMDGPPILPHEDILAALRDYHGAQDNSDFHHPEGYEPWGGGTDTRRYLLLPFSLALGLHPAGPRSINTDAVIDTFDTYASGVSRSETDAERSKRRNNTVSILSASIMNAVVNPRSEYARTDRVKAAIAFSRLFDMLNHRQARLLTRATELTSY